MIHLVLFELFVINLPLFEHQQKNCSLADRRFSGPYGVTKYAAVVEGRMS